MSIQDYFQQAQLALAAYGDLLSGSLSSPENVAELVTDSVGMSPAQASIFAAKWSVVTQYNDADTGLSATVFQEAATGKNYLAVRGTEPSDFLNDILTADGGILLHGIPNLSSQYRSLYAKVADWQASGVLSGSFTVAGHSLGGWLAQGLAVDLGASIEHAYICNAPGVFGGIFGDALQRLNAALGTTFLDPPSLSNVTSLRASEGNSFIAGLGQGLSSPIGILIEDQTRVDISDPAGSRNHSQRVLVDSLALYALFSKIDPTASVESITKIIESASANNGNTLESALDSLRTLFQQNYQYGGLDYDAVPTPSSGTATSRDVYYANLQNLQTWWDTSPFTALALTALAELSSAQISARAMANTPEGQAYRYALYKLSPFALTGSSALYERINAQGELDRYNPSTGSGWLTDQYLKDRAALLSWINQISTTDIQGQIGASGTQAFSVSYSRTPYRFKDESSKVQVDLGGGIHPITQIAMEPRRIHFGSESADTFTGGELLDHLYGMAGADNLAGKAGNDYLEGGTGFDTYLINPGDGHDTILDTDGLGAVNFGSVAARGSAAVADEKDWIQVGNAWTDRQNNLSYLLIHRDDGRRDLYVRADGGSVLIRDWSEGELGIELGLNLPIQPLVTELTLIGDLKPVDFNTTEPGIQARFDERGNVIVSGEAAPGRDDALFGSGGNDHVLGFGGDDYVEGRDGDDLIEGGTGRDVLDGGAGNDSVIGGVESDVIGGMAGDDRLYAETEFALDAAYAEGEGQPGSGQRGDLLDGAEGDDTLIGAAGNDILLGGMGRDVLLGMGGDDNIEGDLGLSSAGHDWAVERVVTADDGVTSYARHYAFPITDTTEGGDDVIYAGAGSDWVVGQGGNDFIDGGSGDDVLFGAAGNDILLGQAGSDVLAGDSLHPALDASLHGDDFLSGGSGNDELWGAGGADVLDGGDDDDTLYGDGERVPAGYEGDDVLDGGSGNDTLYGGGGNDTLTGGAGADYLYGGDGDDVYTDVGVGDVVGDIEGRSDIRLSGATGFAADAGASVAPETDAILSIPLNDGTTLQLQSALYGMSSSIEFASGESFDLETWVSQNLHQSVSLRLRNIELASGENPTFAYGGAAADQLEGSARDDLLRGYGGDDLILGMDGHDLLEGGGGDDHLQGDAGEDVLRGGDGNDGLLGADGDDRVYGDAGGDELQGGLGNDILEGGSGDDTVFGEAGSDVLGGGTGNDVLVGGAGDDLYLFDAGDGQDIIWEEGDSAGDVLRFGAGVAGIDMLATRAGSDLVLLRVNGEEQVTVANWYSGIYWQLARVEFADGAVWNGADMATSKVLLRGDSGSGSIAGGSQGESLVGLDGDDQLDGAGGDDVLLGGKGSDTLRGGTGADTYLFAAGDGADVIDADASDQLRFASDIAPGDIAVERIGHDLLLRHQNGSDSVKVLNWYGSSADQLQQVTFGSDGTRWSAAVLGVMGTHYANHYALGLGDGAKIIEEWGGSDSLTFGVGVFPSDIVVARTGLDLRLAHLNGSDAVTLKGWFASLDGSAWVEEIRFPDDTLWTAEALTAQALNQEGTAGADSLQGINLFGDVLRGRDGNDMLRGYSGDDVLEGGAGYDTLFGDGGNDVLDAGEDGGYAAGGLGDDVYLYEAGDGDVDIVDSGGADTLRFGMGVRAEDVHFLRLGGNLNVAVGDGARIDIASWFSDAEGRTLVERIEFADGTSVTADDLNAVLLVQTGTSGDDELDGTVLGDTLIGAGGDDVLRGDAGNDALLGDDGLDSIYGGAGDDRLQGGVGRDLLFGESGNDQLDGGTDDDYLNGGVGDDEYRQMGLGQDHIVDASGIDILRFASGIAPEDLIVSRVDADLRIGFSDRDDNVVVNAWFRQPHGSIEGLSFSDGREWAAADISAFFCTISGNGGVTGGADDELLYGGAGQDALHGGAGDDLLDGGAGADNLAGGSGNDTYVADAEDVIVELPGEGNDTLVWTSSAAVALQDGLEDLVIAESAGSLMATGNGAANRIVGNSANNRLDGGAGADILDGGLGDDEYVVDDPGDHVIERLKAGGYDRVHAAISYALGEHVEGLSLTGVAAIDGYGNALNNSLLGNDAANYLEGGAGNDSLRGGLGPDVLRGGTGDDTYVLDGYEDVLLEAASEGQDRIYIDQVSAELGNTSYVGTFTMGAHIENLRMTGYVSHASLFGNDLDNVVDVRQAKVYSHQSGYTTWYYHARIDIAGGDGNDTLYGADGGGVLDGGLGDDVMHGGGGYDTYYVDSALDRVIENASAGTDSVYASTSFALGANLENLYLLGTGNLHGTGNELSNALYGNAGDNVLTGGAGDDRLDGGGGSDTLAGGLGDDTYVLNAHAEIHEGEGEGIDRVEASVSHTLMAHLEQLVLLGSAAINGTGNDLDNLIQGNAAINRLEGKAGNDVLDGGAGNDTLLGGTGDDAYYIDSSKDVVTELGGEGNDTVFSPLGYTLGANVENLVLTGAARINGTGNALANRIMGNSASNTLTGGAGDDTLDGGGGIDKLIGGAGNDAYIVDAPGETITERSNEGTDLVLSSIAFTLPSNLENLTLTGTDAVSGTGNKLANVLVGNGAGNVLAGGAGDDILDGMAGADTLIGGTGSDAYFLGRGYGRDTVQEKDTTTGNADVAEFLSGVAADQIWFRQVGNDLEASVIGTDDALVIQDWYLGNAYHVEHFRAAGDGRVLLDGSVQSLVDAMASFAPPAVGQTTLPQAYQDALAGLIAANWQ